MRSAPLGSVGPTAVSGERTGASPLTHGATRSLADSTNFQ